jgi:hypothetical protein
LSSSFVNDVPFRYALSEVMSSALHLGIFDQPGDCVFRSLYFSPGGGS